MKSSSVSDGRVRAMNDKPIRRDGEFVLYWMIAARRTRWNFSLQRAIDWSVELGKPLLVFEALRCGYQWASDRLHRFVIDGMRDNAMALAELPAYYYPYVEPQADQAKGLFAALASSACMIVTDDFPTFFLPRMVTAVSKRVAVRLEAVDTNGLYPMFATDQVFPTAYAFRRHLQKNLPDHLLDRPQKNPFARRKLPPAVSPSAEILRRWPAADTALLNGRHVTLSQIYIDHSVPVAPISGGSETARTALKDFVTHKLARYNEDRNLPSEEATSGLSPYLHFGHISAHEVFEEIVTAENWSPARLAPKATGSREGWWGCSDAAEALLDQVVTWRELGYNFAAHRQDYDQFQSLPEWAQKTLAKHATDRREHVYTLEEFEQAKTHDPLWNAAQRQIVREGRMHNYLRMLWGKKILEWTASPREALQVMIELNNKYGLDGRNPNSYSGIFWILGRYDRPWGPERQIFGTVRYMSSDNTARKFNVKPYLTKYGPQATLF